MYQIMVILISLTIFSGLLGQLVKMPLASGNLYPVDLMVVLTLLVWIFTKLVGRDYKFVLPKFFVPLFFFLLWGLVCLVLGKNYVSNTEFLTGVSYFLRLTFYSFIGLVASDLKREKSLTILTNVLVLSSLLLAVAGFIQLLIYPDLAKLAFEFGYDPHKNRLVSTFLDPNFTAAYLVLGLALLFSRGKDDSRSSTTSLYSNVVKLGMVAVIFVALLLTFSRSGWLMFSMVLLLFGFLKSPKLLLVALLVGFLAYFAIPRVQTRLSGLTDPDDSAKLRLVSWSRALTIFKGSPIFGVGYNLYRPAQEKYGFFDFHDLKGGHAGSGSDSSFLLVLATTGLVGLTLFLILYSSLFWSSLKNISQPAGLALAFTLFGLFLDGQIINSLFYPQILLWFWILVGLAAKKG